MLPFVPRGRTALLLGLLFLSTPLSACTTAAHRPGDQVLQLELRSPDEAVGLRHYPGPDARVLLVGNPGISPRIFDIPGYGGLAPYLQNAGFDVWVVDWQELPEHADLSGLAGWLAEVIHHVGREGDVTVIGHGLGGVTAVLAGAHDHVGRYVFLATPGNLSKPLDPVAAFAGQSWRQGHSLAEARTVLAGPKQATAMMEALLWNFGTFPVDADKLDQLFTPVGPRLLNDLSTAVRQGGWGQAFERALSEIRVPVTVLVGQTDSIAPPWQSHAVYRKVSSETRYYRFFSRALGERREYGHLSLLIGDDAVQEVYPFITRAVRLEAP